MALVPLSQGLSAIVDEEDLPLLLQYSWHATRSGNNTYARTCLRGRKYLSMHELLLGHKNVDHINLDGLDNRKKNLRPATNSQNQANRSGVKGVYPARRGWQAHIMCKGVRYNKFFSTEQEAIRWRKDKFRELFGEFAPK